MFKDWLKLVTTDCTVLQLSETMFVYPMYKNGSTSLKYYSEKNHLNVLKNKEMRILIKIQQQKYNNYFRVYYIIKKIQVAS